MKHAVLVTPAEDNRSDDPEKNRGIQTSRLKFGVVGDDGAYVFGIDTGWQLRPVAEQLRRVNNIEPLLPIAWEAAMHWKAPRAGATPHPGCEFQLEGYCWKTEEEPERAQRFFNTLIEEGSPALFIALERAYRLEIIAVGEKR